MAAHVTLAITLARLPEPVVLRQTREITHTHNLGRGVVLPHLVPLGSRCCWPRGRQDRAAKHQAAGIGTHWSSAASTRCRPPRQTALGRNCCTGGKKKLKTNLGKITWENALGRNLGVPRCRGSAASRWRMGPARYVCLIPAARAHRARFARQRARGWAAIPGPEALG